MTDTAAAVANKNHILPTYSGDVLENIKKEPQEDFPRKNISLEVPEKPNNESSLHHNNSSKPVPSFAANCTSFECCEPLVTSAKVLIKSEADTGKKLPLKNSKGSGSAKKKLTRQEVLKLIHERSLLAKKRRDAAKIKKS